MSKTLLSVNINGAKPYSYTSGVERTIAMNASKLLKLYDYAKRYRYAVVCIQETHSEKVGDIYDHIFPAYNAQVHHTMYYMVHHVLHGVIRCVIKI